MTSALVVLLALSGQTYYSPDEAQAIFSGANDAYSRGDFAEAAAGYRKLVDRGQAGADVLFNLGTTYLSAGDLGQAVLFLERAKAAGGGEDVDANLAVATSQQADKVVGEAAGEPFMQRVARAVDPDAASIAFLATWLCAFALLATAVFRRRWWVVLFGLGSLMLSLVLGTLVSAHAWVDANVKEGVVLSEVVRVRDLPKDTARVSFEVHAGLRVRLLDAADAYVRVRLPNGLEGWAERKAIADL